MKTIEEKKQIMNWKLIILIVVLSVVLLPISMPYWLAWSFAEVFREEDGTIWEENPFTFWK